MAEPALFFADFTRLSVLATSKGNVAAAARRGRASRPGWWSILLARLRRAVVATKESRHLIRVVVAVPLQPKACFARLAVPGDSKVSRTVGIVIIIKPTAGRVVEWRNAAFFGGRFLPLCGATVRVLVPVLVTVAPMLDAPFTRFSGERNPERQLVG